MLLPAHSYLLSTAILIGSLAMSLATLTPLLCNSLFAHPQYSASDILLTVIPRSHAVILFFSEYVVFVESSISDCEK